MKRERDPDEELADKLEQVQTLIDSLKKKAKPAKEEVKQEVKEKECDTQQKIAGVIGDVVDETPVEVKYLPLGVKTYSFLVKYPNSINSKNRADILSIEHIIEGAVETLSPGVAKLTVVYCPDEGVAIEMHSKTLGEKNESLNEPHPVDFDSKIMREVESFIPFCKGEAPRSVINPCLDKVVQVIKGQKVVSPVKFTQLDKIPNRKVIQDIEVGPTKDSNDLFITVKYLKQV